MVNWTSAYETMRDDLDIGNDAIGVFAVNLKFNLDDFQSTATESLTGGGDDKKCDLIHIDKSLGVAVVAQCYVAENPNKTAPANKASDLNTAMTWLLSAPIDTLPNAIRGPADELRSAICDKEISQLYVWYVHNCNSGKNVADELMNVERTAQVLLGNIANGADISISAVEIGKGEISDLYKQAEQTIIVTDKFDLKVTDAMQIEQEDWSSVITYVSGSWLKSLYKKYGVDLFSANLRGYLGSRSSDANINNGIKTTVAEEPSNFFVYNNGITAIVTDHDLAARTRSGRKLQITGLSIVNGAQTTGSIASVVDDIPENLLVAIRFIKAKQKQIVTNVVKFNNSQNKLQAADFRSNDPIQEKLRNEFLQIPNAEYEGGRRGGASDAIKRSKYTLPSYAVAQALTAFHGEAVAAYDKKSDLWLTNARYQKIFTDRTTARHIVFCYSLLNFINQTKSQLVKSSKALDQEIKEVDRAKLEFLNNKGANFLLVMAISRSLEVILGKSIPNKFDIRFKDNLSPEAATKNWEPIFEMMLSLAVHLEGAFSKNRIYSEGVETTVPQFVALIDSLKTVQKQTFDDFARIVKT